MESAIQRPPRFQGQAIFQIDNAEEKYRPVVEATPAEVEWTWTQSGLNYHASAMMLDDRASTTELRRWFRQLTQQR